MGNAPAVVQQKADWVTTKNTEMGILKALACAFGQI
jgi:hydroxymethylpyrimidine pyrophosphatase-like HAD family hydrolase